MLDIAFIRQNADAVRAAIKNKRVDVDLDALLANLQAVHPGISWLLTSARTGEGVDALRDWLLSKRRSEAPAAV